MTDDDDDGAVGYGRPPKASRFQKGRSGNPKGRPRGSRNLTDMVREAALETVTINAKGRRRKVSKLEAALMQQANKAAGGDPKATKMLTDLLFGAEAREQAGAGVHDPAERRRADAQILKTIKARLGRNSDDQEA